MRIQKSSPQRKAATTVEFAVVCIPLFLFLFGIYEYGRFVFTLQVMENSAREGARYAIVHTYDPTVAADTIAKVREHLAGADVSAFGAPATLTVYAADNSGTNLGSPLNAPFGTFIGVRIQGGYRTAVPNLLLMSDVIQMDTRTLMNSEAN